MSQFNLVNEQVDRLTSMLEIATVQYSLECSEIALDALTRVRVMAPLPEVHADVKAFVAEYEEAVPLMVPCFDFLFPREEEAPWCAHLVDDYVQFEIVDRFLEDLRRTRVYAC